MVADRMFSQCPAKATAAAAAAAAAKATQPQPSHLVHKLILLVKHMRWQWRCLRRTACKATVLLLLLVWLPCTRQRR